jgi:hypothetical protein
MRHFQSFAHLEEPGMAPSWVPESLGMEELKKA